MKNMKAIVLLVLAIITGLAAAVYAASWVSQRGNIASTKVVVAAVDVELGSRLNPQMLSESGMAKRQLFHRAPSGISRPCRTGWRRRPSCAASRSPRSKLAPIGTKGGLSAVIAEGKRAMTVKVNDVIGVAGFALPGNYVDVMVNTHRTRPAASRDQMSTIVLEQILVLAVARSQWRRHQAQAGQRRHAGGDPGTPRSSTWRAASAPCRWCFAARPTRRRWPPRRRRDEVRVTWA